MNQILAADPSSILPDGSLKVTPNAASYDLTSGVVAALNSQLAVDVSAANSLTVHAKNTGTVTMAAGVITFEGSMNSTNGTDGDWFAIIGSRTNANSAESAFSPTTLAAGAGNVYGWKFTVAGIKWFRARVSTALTASSVATLTALRSSSEIETTPAIGTHAVTGSGTFSVAPATTGVTGYALTSAATTNLAIVNAAASTVGEITVFNPTAAVIYVKLYNKITNPTLASDIPLLVIPVAINGLAQLDFGQLGKRFSTGIAIAITGGPTHTDATAVATGAVVSLTRI